MILEQFHSSPAVIATMCMLAFMSAGSRAEDAPGAKGQPPILAT